MNGSLHSTDAVDIKLKRGPTGFGFNIVGGVDQHYLFNDSAIFVSKIKEDGVAALDGRLQEGDKILAINGVKLKNLTHGDAVELFKKAGEEVELHVQKKSNGSGDSSAPSLGLLATVMGAAAIFAFIYVRYIRKHF